MLAQALCSSFDRCAVLAAAAQLQLAGQNEAVQSLLTVPPDYLDSTKVGKWGLACCASTYSRLRTLVAVPAPLKSPQSAHLVHHRSAPWALCWAMERMPRRRGAGPCWTAWRHTLRSRCAVVWTMMFSV